MWRRAFAGLITISFAASGAAQEQLAPDVVCKLVLDSVVRITIKDSNGYRFSGTGFFANDDQHVVTSYHVVSGAVEIGVEGTGQATWKVVQVKINKASDLALLKLENHTGRKPLPYTSLAGIAPKGRTVTVGNLLNLDANNLSSGSVDAIVKVQDQTILKYTPEATPEPLGSPVFDLRARVVAVQRAPFQDAPDQCVAGTVLGINFLSGPIPWTAFAAGVRESTATETIDSPKKGSNAANVRMAQTFAKWLDGVLMADLRWQNAYLQVLSQAPPRDPSALDEPFKAIQSAADAGLDSLKGATAGVEGISVDQINNSVQSYLKASSALLAAQKKNIVDGQQADLSKAAQAAGEYDQAQAAFAGAQTSLCALLTDEPWFTWSEVSYVFDPQAWGALFTQATFDACPSVDRPDAAVIGGAYPGSDFQEGDVIDGIALNSKDDYTPVSGWKQIGDYALLHLQVKRFYVRVKRRGAHAMFFSRPASE